MKKRYTYSLVILASLGLGIFGAANPETSPQVTKQSQQIKKLKSENSQLTKQFNQNKKKIKVLKDEISFQKDENTKPKERLSDDLKDQKNDSDKLGVQSKLVTDKYQLANVEYTNEHEITVNGGNPQFSEGDLNTSKGAWQVFSNLDSLNRVGKADALLNISLMPTTKRGSLTWNPTGWHNKKIKKGWLYNRSHLIGYQLTGENNNPKNLMTGTSQLNNPYMLMHEMDIAYYLKQSKSHFVRYRVTPIFRNTELLARGVQLEAKSVGDNQISFNYYIFNAQDGVTLNYTDGTSQIQ